MLDWFNDWMVYHADLFGMDSERELATFASWRDVFAAAGYTREELFAASLHLAQRPDLPRFRDAHLRALQEHVRAARTIREQEARPDDRGTCTLCSGSGRVVVPHLRCVADSAWRPLQIARGGAHYYTCAVLCRCPLGLWLAKQQKQRQLTLEEYERRNPLWRAQTAARREEQLAQARAGSVNSQLDRTLGALLRARLGDAYEGKD